MYAIRSYYAGVQQIPEFKVAEIGERLGDPARGWPQRNGQRGVMVPGLRPPPLTLEHFGPAVELGPSPAAAEQVRKQHRLFGTAADAADGVVKGGVKTGLV